MKYVFQDMCIEFVLKKTPSINSISASNPMETPNPLTFPSLAEGTTKVAFWTLTSLGFMFFQIPSTRCHIEIQLLPKIKGLQMWCDQQECQVWRAIPISFLFVRNKKVAKSKPNKEICDLFGVQMFNETYSSNKNHLHPKHAILIPFLKLKSSWQVTQKLPWQVCSSSLSKIYLSTTKRCWNSTSNTKNLSVISWSMKIPGPNWPPPAKGSLLDLTPSPLKQTQEKTATWMSAEFWKWLVYRL